MTYDFFAAQPDKIDFLNFIFNETDLHVFDSYSPYGEGICEYKTTGEIISKFDMVDGDKFAVTFQLWSPRFKANPVFRKVDLDPKKCKGHKFRYATEGWGLIQLYFGGIKDNNINSSHIGHNSQKRALAWEDINPLMGKVNDWDWQEVEKTSRRLKYQLHNKMAEKKFGARGVLKGAALLENQGLKFF